MGKTIVFCLRRMIPRYNAFLFQRFLASKVPPEDVSKGKYGFYGLIQSAYTKDDVHFTSIRAVDISKQSSQIWVRGRLHTSRDLGNSCFITVRQQLHTIQGFISVNARTSKKFVEFVAKIKKESIIDVLAEVRSVEKKVTSCSQSDVELHILQLFIVFSAELCLPFQLNDASRPDDYDGDLPSVNHYLRLKHRAFDIRTPTNQAIFKIQAGICQTFRDLLSTRGFTEIHTPKIVSAASEGGTNVFHVNYFGSSACLTQSPQLYKQMAIAGDFGRVFTVGAVFRAEESRTSRHLTEFVGLDFEMAFNFHYHEVLRMIFCVMTELFTKLQDEFANEIATVAKQYPIEPFLFTEEPVILKYSEGVALLREHGVQQDDLGDLSSENERCLGELVRAKYKTDFYVLDKFPLAVRPFYTMPDPNDVRFSNSYDIYMRGQEILSGGQRVHDAALLMDQAKLCGIDLQKICAYLDTFGYGCPPHAGGGIGLERVTMLFLGIKNIRLASLFPRSVTRLVP